MSETKTITSLDGTKILQVVERSSGGYTLQSYLKKYDAEEDCEYTVRSLPDPTGVFEKILDAVYEANRLLGL